MFYKRLNHFKTFQMFTGLVYNLFVSCLNEICRSHFYSVILIKYFTPTSLLACGPVGMLTVLPLFEGKRISLCLS